LLLLLLLPLLLLLLLSVVCCLLLLFTLSYKDRLDISENRKKIFEDYAKQHGFDPSDGSKWDAQPRNQLLKIPGIYAAIAQHGNSLAKTINDLFPDINFGKFSRLKKGLFSTVEQRRNFFIDYAKSHGFEPLNPENWYIQSRKQILATKAGARVAFFYGNSMARALLELFPDIGFEKTKLMKAKTHWHDPPTRKVFLERYAKENQLDLMNPEQWHTHNFANLQHTKALKIIKRYHGSIFQALLDLFSENNGTKSK